MPSILSVRSKDSADQTELSRKCTSHPVIWPSSSEVPNLRAAAHNRAMAYSQPGRASGEPVRMRTHAAQFVPNARTG